LLVRQIDLIGWPRTFDGGLGRFAPGLPASRRGLGVACRKPGLILGLLTVEAFLGPRLDLGSGLGELC
jgi:hypothetical protein